VRRTGQSPFENDLISFGAPPLGGLTCGRLKKTWADALLSWRPAPRGIPERGQGGGKHVLKVELS